MRLLVGTGSRVAAMPPRPVRDQIKEWGGNLDLYVAGNRYHFPSVTASNPSKGAPPQPPPSQSQDSSANGAADAASAPQAARASPADSMLRPLLPRNIKQCLKSGPGEGARVLGKERLKQAECFLGIVFVEEFYALFQLYLVAGLKVETSEKTGITVYHPHTDDIFFGGRRSRSADKKGTHKSELPNKAARFYQHSQPTKELGGRPRYQARSKVRESIYHFEEARFIFFYFHTEAPGHAGSSQ